jgi:hypothetical protein
MDDNGNGVSALLGLDGFIVSAQLLDEATGEWWLAIETTEIGRGARRAACGLSVTADGG